MMVILKCYYSSGITLVLLSSDIIIAAITYKAVSCIK